MAGSAGAVDRRAASVARIVLDRVAATPDREAFRYPAVGDQWRSMTWAEVGERVRAVAAGLLALGLRPEHRVAIIATTRVEWALVDFAVLCAGGATTIDYPATNPDEVAYILADSGSWFDAAGLLILEGYGLTESSAGAFVNRPDSARFGTAGPPLPGTEVRIADDSEVLLPGPGVMRGYHRLPEQTAAALTADGWLHTGDIGELDAVDRLRLTDPKKDLIKTSGGKYVAPQPIEVLIAGICPLASHLVVPGDGRNYCTALVTLDPEELAAWARGHGLPGDPADPAGHAELAGREEVRAVVAAGIGTLNARLNRWETIKDFRILDHDLTVEAGELTPSLKVKRRAVEARYRGLVDEMYGVPAHRS